MGNSAHDLARRLARNAEAVCRYYLSNGRRSGRYWVVGDIMNTPGRSMYVLVPVRGNGPFGGMARAWKRTIKRTQLAGVKPHTLRHSYASVAGDLGFTESTIAALLGHAAGSVTSRYVHHLDSVLVAAADKVARAIYGMMTTDPTKA